MPGLEAVHSARPMHLSSAATSKSRQHARHCLCGFRSASATRTTRWRRWAWRPWARCAPRTRSTSTAPGAWCTPPCQRCRRRRAWRPRGWACLRTARWTPRRSLRRPLAWSRCCGLLRGMSMRRCRPQSRSECIRIWGVCVANAWVGLLAHGALDAGAHPEKAAGVVALLWAATGHAQAAVPPWSQRGHAQRNLPTESAIGHSTTHWRCAPCAAKSCAP